MVTDKYFTVPDGVRVIKACMYGWPDYYASYVGVTQGSQHTFKIKKISIAEGIDYRLVCIQHLGDVEWDSIRIGEDEPTKGFYKLEWSPEINMHTPTITDY